MGFQVYEKGSVKESSIAPTATLSKRGVISLNAPAQKLIESTESVELLYDPDERVIGLRPIAPDNPNGFPVRAAGVNGGRGLAEVTATKFVQYWDIDTSVTRRWEVHAEDGILRIELTQEGKIISRSNRNGRDVGDVAAADRTPSSP